MKVSYSKASVYQKWAFVKATHMDKKHLQNSVSYLSSLWWEPILDKRRSLLALNFALWCLAEGSPV